MLMSLSLYIRVYINSLKYPNHKFFVKYKNSTMLKIIDSFVECGVSCFVLCCYFMRYICMVM
jgi:hypothetical protein